MIQGRENDDGYDSCRELSEVRATLRRMSGQDLYSAAWVPDDDPNRPWDEAAALAVDWVLGEARRLGAAPLLVTPTKQQWDAGAGPIQRFALEYDAATPRSSRPSPGAGPVLVYVPDYRTFDFAARCARGASLAVVESIGTPLSGWAVEARAINLLTGEVTPDERTAEQRTALDRLHFYGNNGWTTGFGKNQAGKILLDLRRQGLLDQHMILGCMLAKGHSADAVLRLEKMIVALGH